MLGEYDGSTILVLLESFFSSLSIAVAMGFRLGREEVVLCSVIMMAVRSLYCRNHSSHLRRLISSVDLTIKIHKLPPSSEPTTAPK